MRTFIHAVNEIICEVLDDFYHEGWESIFELFFTYLANSSTTGFDRLVADAVTDYVCNTLSDDFVLTDEMISAIYALYENCAGDFRSRMREHIETKVNYSDLCEVA